MAALGWLRTLASSARMGNIGQKPPFASLLLNVCLSI